MSRQVRRRRTRPPTPAAVPVPLTRCGRGMALSPIAAARMYALVSVAQYGAVVAVDESAGDATLVAQGDGFGPGGRSRYEAERGAVAGASTQVLSFLFPAAAAALEQRLASEGE